MWEHHEHDPTAVSPVVAFGAMTTYHVLIFLNPVEGREDDFQEWYENTHLDEVLATTGMRSAQRFGLEMAVGLEMPNSHLAVYETEADSAEEVMDRLNSTRDQRAQTDSMDAANVAMWVFSALGEKHIAT